MPSPPPPPLPHAAPAACLPARDPARSGVVAPLPHAAPAACLPSRTPSPAKQGRPQGPTLHGGRRLPRSLYKPIPGAAAVKKTDLVLLILHACGGRPVRDHAPCQARVPVSSRSARRRAPGAPGRAVRLYCAPLRAACPRHLRRDRPPAIRRHGRGRRQPVLHNLQGIPVCRAAPSSPPCARGEELDRIERIKSRGGGEDLDDLLRHVYTAHPEFAIRSEILDRVAGQRRGIA